MPKLFDRTAGLSKLLTVHFECMAENVSLCHDKVKRSHKRPMKSINISLPDVMRTYVEEQVADGTYSTISEYFRELVRQDQKRKAKEHLETLLLEGLNSGNSTPLTEQDWDDIRQAVRAKVSQQKGLNENG
jgi:antitoxin ParD1/3/4